MSTILHLENEDFDEKNMLKNELIFSDKTDKIEKIEKNDLCMIMIYAEWCPYCVHALPIYDNFVEQYKDKNVNFFKINGSNDEKSKESEKQLMKRIATIVGEKVTFPSFYFFKNGKKIGKHTRDRTIEEFQMSVNMYK